MNTRKIKSAKYWTTGSFVNRMICSHEFHYEHPRYALYTFLFNFFLSRSNFTFYRVYFIMRNTSQNKCAKYYIKKYQTRNFLFKILRVEPIFSWKRTPLFDTWIIQKDKWRPNPPYSEVVFDIHDSNLENSFFFQMGTFQKLNMKRYELLVEPFSSVK